MTHAELEVIYETLALKIDEVGENSELYLAKLALLLAYNYDDVNEVHKHIQSAAESLD